MSSILNALRKLEKDAVRNSRSADSVDPKMLVDVRRTLGKSARGRYLRIRSVTGAVVVLLVLGVAWLAVHTDRIGAGMAAVTRWFDGGSVTGDAPPSRRSSPSVSETAGGERLGRQSPSPAASRKDDARRAHRDRRRPDVREDRRVLSRADERPPAAVRTGVRTTDRPSAGPPDRSPEFVRRSFTGDGTVSRSTEPGAKTRAAAAETTGPDAPGNTLEAAYGAAPTDLPPALTEPEASARSRKDTDRGDSPAVPGRRGARMAVSRPSQPDAPQPAPAVAKSAPAARREPVEVETGAPGAAPPSAPAGTAEPSAARDAGKRVDLRNEPAAAGDAPSDRAETAMVRIRPEAAESTEPAVDSDNPFPDAPFLTDDTIRFQALVWSADPADRMVVINNEILRIGGSVGGFTVAHITADTVFLSHEGEVRKMQFNLK